MSAITVNFNSIIDITDEQFYKLCVYNPDAKFERNADGEIVVMSPTGGATGKRNTDLIGQLWLWNRKTRLGEVFDSSTGYKLPNGANRSPDVSWLKKERWNKLTIQQKLIDFLNISIKKFYDDFTVNFKFKNIRF